MSCHQEILKFEGLLSDHYKQLQKNNILGNKRFANTVSLAV